MRGDPIINNEVKRSEKKRQAKQRKVDLRIIQTNGKYQWRKMLRKKKRKGRQLLRQEPGPPVEMCATAGRLIKWFVTVLNRLSPEGPVAVAAVLINPALFFPPAAAPPLPPPPPPAPPAIPVEPPPAPLPPAEAAPPPPAPVSEATMTAAMSLSGMSID